MSSLTCQLRSTFCWLLMLATLAPVHAAERIVSLDYCADQYALRIAPEKIIAVSPDARSDFSYMRRAAVDVRTVRPTAENVLALKPDLVIRSYGGGPNAGAFYTRLGIRVVQLGYAATLADIRSETVRIASELGREALGKTLAKEMDERLAGIQKERSGVIMYMTPGGVTTGPGTLMHEVLIAAGYRNFETSPGWRSLPLEALAGNPPPKIATAFYGRGAEQRFLWSAARHPLVKDLISARGSVNLDDATTTCSAWFIVDAIERLAAAGSGP